MLRKYIVIIGLLLPAFASADSTIVDLSYRATYQIPGTSTTTVVYDFSPFTPLGVESISVSSINLYSSAGASTWTVVLKNNSGQVLCGKTRLVSSVVGWAGFACSATVDPQQTYTLELKGDGGNARWEYSLGSASIPSIQLYGSDSTSYPVSQSISITSPGNQSVSSGGSTTTIISYTNPYLINQINVCVAEASSYVDFYTSSSCIEQSAYSATSSGSISFLVDVGAEVTSRLIYVYFGASLDPFPGGTKGVDYTSVVTGFNGDTPPTDPRNTVSTGNIASTWVCSGGSLLNDFASTTACFASWLFVPNTQSLNYVMTSLTDEFWESFPFSVISDFTSMGASLFTSTTTFSLSIPVPTGVGTSTDLVILDTSSTTALGGSLNPIFSVVRTMLSSCLWILFGLWLVQMVNGVLHVRSGRDTTAGSLERPS